MRSSFFRDIPKYRKPLTKKRTNVDVLNTILGIDNYDYVMLNNN